MRVDNDWENGIGKKLFDLEGEVSPDAWKNINQRIKPPQNNRYRWLPALLALLLVPTAVLVTDPLNWLENDEESMALEPASQETAVSENSATKTVGINPEKPATATLETKQIEKPNTETSPFVKNQRAATATLNLPETAALTKPKTNNQPDVIAWAGNSQNVQPVTGSEENKQNDTKADKPNAVTNPLLQAAKNATVSGEKTEDAYAENKPANRRTERKENTHVAISSAAKTVGSGTQKPETLAVESAAKTSKNPSEIAAVKSNATAQNATVNQEKTATEIAALPFKNNAFAIALSAEDFAKTLPDSVKKVLIAGLPEPEPGEKPETQPKTSNQLKNWNFAVFGGPQYAFQRILPNTGDEISVLALKNKNVLETERLGYEFGFRASYEVRPNLEVVFGFQATKISQFLRVETASFQPDSVSVVQNGNGISMQLFHQPREEEFRFKYYFGGLFTGLNLRISEKMDLSGGLGANWLLQTKTASEQTPVPTSAFNPYLNLGLQYKQPLSPKVTLTAGPAMQYYLKPVQSQQAFIGMKPTTIGFNVGLKYKP